MTYSQDLRDRVLNHLEDGEHSQAETADLFGISLSTLEKWWHQYQRTGACTARPHGGPKRKLAVCDDLIARRVAAEPDVSLAVLCEYVQTEQGVTASPSMMSRTLAFLQLPRKKKSEHDSQRATPRVQALRQTFITTQVPSWPKPLDQVKFLDETGIHCGLTPCYGRAAPGKRVVEATPGQSGTHYTLTAVLTAAGLEAPWVLEGAMTGATFETYVEQFLCPSLRRGDIVVMDNLSAHKGPTIQALIEACGARLVFLPPYSSDFNPIELAWAKVKNILRRAKARTFEPLVEAVARAVSAVTDANRDAWFKHCGYV